MGILILFPTHGTGNMFNIPSAPRTMLLVHTNRALKSNHELTLIFYTFMTKYIYTSYTFLGSFLVIKKNNRQYFFAGDCYVKN